MSLETKKCFVLSKVNYGDHDLIFECLTEEGEILSFFLKNAFKVKTKVSQVGVIQVGHFLDINFHRGRSFCRPREIRISQQALFDFYRKDLRLFILFTDLMKITKAIVRDFASKELFDYLYNTFANIQRLSQLNNASGLLFIYNLFLFFCLDNIGVNFHEIKGVEILENIESMENMFKLKETYFYNAGQQEVVLNTKTSAQDFIKLMNKYKKYLQKLFSKKISDKIVLEF